MRPEDVTGRNERIGLDKAATDVYITAQKVVVSVELPGVALEAIDIAEEAQQVTISAARPLGTAARYHRIERSHGDFLSQVSLPVAVQSSSRALTLEDGVLTIEWVRA
jgi:HSP20 family molecular chaperone IbpA